MPVHLVVAVLRRIGSGFAFLFVVIPARNERGNIDAARENAADGAAHQLIRGRH
jgi:hypothetical protein